MAKIIRPAHTERREEKCLEYRFRNDPGTGFSFDWENEKPVFKVPEAVRNYEWCLSHPEEVECIGIITQQKSWQEPAIAKCECGETIFLLDHYFGCSQCPHCGRWHSLWGQEVNPPEEWTEELEPD